MANSQNKMWDERYASESFVYGIHPNEFFKKELLKLDVGRILMPAEGEGRNAVFAASQKWEVVAFDLSNEGRLKALNLAKENKVKINYEVACFENFNAEKESFDCIALIYAHVPEAKRQAYHRIISEYLKPGGVLILEGFSKEQLGRESGGPGQVEILYSTENLIEDFSDLETVSLQKVEVELSEGVFHQGLASVIRYVGKKPIKTK